LVRDQIRDIFSGHIDKFTFGRTDYQFRTWSEKNTTGQYKIYWNTGDGADLKVLFYDSICHAEGFGLFLTKDCDLIAALTPCKQNFLSSFRP
jgi:hypothetical protein